MFRVTLIGPDGCGKSAVAEQLTRTIRVPVRRIYMGVNLESSNVMLPTARLLQLIRRWRNAAPDDAGPRGLNTPQKPTVNVFRRILRFCRAGIRTLHNIADECYRLAVIRWWLVCGYLVVQDRDYYVDFCEYDITGEHRTFWQRVHGSFLSRIYSRPDLSILLDVSAKTMLQRKHEGAVEGLHRRREHYRELLQRMPAGEVVDAESDLSSVTNLVRDCVMNFRQQKIAASRWGKRAHNDQPRLKAQNGPPVVIVGMDCATGLQSSRILSSHGIRVVGIAARCRHFCCRTNSLERLIDAPASGPGLIHTLQSLRKEFSADPVLLPCTDLSVLTISQYRDQLEQSYRFVLPPHDLLHSLIDKVKFTALGEKHNFTAPRSRVLTSTADAEQAADELNYPVFMKPAVKTATWEANTSLKAVRVESAAHLLTAWKTFSKFSETLIAQEYIYGSVDNCFTVNVYFDRNGELQCLYSSQKMRQWPPEFGTASAARGIRSDGIAAQATEFFRTLSFRGLGYIEFKRDVRTGQHLIIEPNIGRPTGRSAMADASGVPLLLTMYCDASGLPLPVAEIAPSCTADVSVQWIHIRRDVQAALRALRRGETPLWTWIRTLRGRKIFAVANRQDTMPFMAECCRYFGQLILRTKRTPRRKVTSIDRSQEALSVGDQTL